MYVRVHVHLWLLYYVCMYMYLACVCVCDSGLPTLQCHLVLYSQANCHVLLTCYVFYFYSLYTCTLIMLPLFYLSLSLSLSLLSLDVPDQVVKVTVTLLSFFDALVSWPQPSNNFGLIKIIL